MSGGSASKEFGDLKEKYGQLRSTYEKYFPKVEPKLVEELVSYGSNSADSKDRLYALQIIGKEGSSLGRVRQYLSEKTGRVPTEYEGGTHYVVNVYPTLDMIKDIRGFEEVERISGDYTFGSYSMHGIHEHRGEDEESRIRQA
jgi:hypothetical protein